MDIEKCAHCDALISEENLVVLDGIACDSCQDEFAQCDRCEAYVHSDETTDVAGETWCEHCADRHAQDCADCGAATPCDNLTDVGGRQSYHYICDCCTEDYTCCEDCGDWLRQDDAFFHDGYAYHEDCIPRDERIHEYSTDVLRVLGARPPTGKLAFGIELEVEVASARDNADKTCCDHWEQVSQNGDLSRDAIAKSDSSLDAGYEIVSRPLLYGEAKKYIVELSLALDNVGGVKSGDTKTCGMHIHASKSALSPMQIEKMMCFLAKPEHQFFIQTIAQRDPEKWAATSVEGVKMGCARKCFSSKRYVALNVTQHTVEMRIFRGSIREDRLLKNLEFYQSLIAFCAPARTSCKEITLKNYKAFLSAHKKEYSNLIKFINEKGV